MKKKREKKVLQKRLRKKSGRDLGLIDGRAANWVISSRAVFSILHV